MTASLNNEVGCKDVPVHTGSPRFDFSDPATRRSLALAEAEKLPEGLARSLLQLLAEQQPEHPDDFAVQRFSIAMSEKLSRSRAKGRGGWDDPNDCPVSLLADLLVGHLFKTNPGNIVDIGTLAMMLHQRGAHESVLASSLHRIMDLHHEVQCTCNPQPVPFTADGTLAACPCCGSVEVGGCDMAVYCASCGLTIEAPRPLRNAINAWNTRNGSLLTSPATATSETASGQGVRHG